MKAGRNSSFANFPINYLKIAKSQKKFNFDWLIEKTESVDTPTTVSWLRVPDWS